MKIPLHNVTTTNSGLNDLQMRKALVQIACNPFARGHDLGATRMQMGGFAALADGLAKSLESDGTVQMYQGPDGVLVTARCQLEAAYVGSRDVLNQDVVDLAQWISVPQERLMGPLRKRTWGITEVPVQKSPQEWVDLYGHGKVLSEDGVHLRVEADAQGGEADADVTWSFMSNDEARKALRLVLRSLKARVGTGPAPPRTAPEHDIRHALLTLTAESACPLANVLGQRKSPVTITTAVEILESAIIPGGLDEEHAYQALVAAASEE